MKEKLILMFGGRSAEYEVSLSSVYNVSKALDREKYDVIMIGMTRDGVWYRYTGGDDDIKNSLFFIGKEHVVYGAPSACSAAYEDPYRNRISRRYRKCGHVRIGIISCFLPALPPGERNVSFVGLTGAVIYNFQSYHMSVSEVTTLSPH